MGHLGGTLSVKDTSWIILALTVVVVGGYLLGYLLYIRGTVSGLPPLHWNNQLAPKPWW